MTKLEMQDAPRVAVIMGSKSDLATMHRAAELLAELGVLDEAKVVSAHRTPDFLFDYVGAAEARGIQVIIAGAGGAAHLHRYGKKRPAVGLKMGHVLILDEDGQDGAEVAGAIAVELERAVAAGPGERAWT